MVSVQFKHAAPGLAVSFTCVFSEALIIHTEEARWRCRKMTDYHLQHHLRALAPAAVTLLIYICLSCRSGNRVLFAL